MNHLTSRLSRVALAVAPAFLLAEARAATIYGVAVQGQTQSLVTWNSSAPGTILSSTPITNLPAGETIRGIDFDPVYFPGNLRLFAIGAGNDGFANVYRIGVSTGTVTKLSSLGGPPANANGTFYGVTSVGSSGLRSTNDAGRLAGYSTVTNSGAGAGSLTYASGDVHEGITAHAVHFYTNYVVDTSFDILASFPSFGTSDLSTVGALGADFDDHGAIDRDETSGIMYAALQPAGEVASRFYTINLQSGQATLLGPIANQLVTAMAVEPPVIQIPEPREMIAPVLLATFLGLITLPRPARILPKLPQ